MKAMGRKANWTNAKRERLATEYAAGRRDGLADVGGIGTPLYRRALGEARKATAKRQA